MKDFLETLSAATFTRRSRSCWGKNCRECPWFHTCQPLLEDEDVGESRENEAVQSEETGPSAPDSKIAAEISPQHTLFPEPEFFSAQSLAKNEQMSADDYMLGDELLGINEGKQECEDEYEQEDDSTCRSECKAGCESHCRLECNSECKCRPDCPPQCKPDCKPQCPPCSSDCEAERCKVLRSIARTENALAAILEAEGAKLQKAVEVACTVAELLEVDKSVQITLARAAALEQALYLKLEALEFLRQ